MSPAELVQTLVGMRAFVEEAKLPPGVFHWETIDQARAEALVAELDS